MEKKHIKVLLIEDSQIQIEMTHLKLKEKENLLVIESSWAKNLSEGLKMLSNDDSFDLVLLEIMLPDSSGVNTYITLRNQAPDIPVVVLTGLKDEELAMKLIQMGVQDYVFKYKFDPDYLVHSIMYAIERQKILQLLNWETSTQGKAFKTQRTIQYEFEELTLRYEGILDTIQNIIFETNNNTCTWINKTGMEYFGEDVVGKEFILNEGKETLASMIDNKGIIHFRSWEKRKDGKRYLLSWSVKELMGKDGINKGFLFVSGTNLGKNLENTDKKGQDLRLGQILINKNIINQEQLDKALVIHKRKKFKFLAQILREEGYCTQEDINTAIKEQQEKTFLGHLLMNNGSISEEQLELCLAEQIETDELLGTILVNRGFCSVDEVQLALKKQNRDNRIGSLVIRKNYINEEQLETALMEQVKTGILLGEVLIRLGFITPDDLADILIQQAKINSSAV